MTTIRIHGAKQNNLKDVLGKNANEEIKSSPRRQFFENLVMDFLKK